MRSSLQMRRNFKSTTLPAEALDHRPAADELVFKPFEAPIEVVDTIHHCLTFGGQGSDNQRYGSAEVGRHHGRAMETIDAFNRGSLAVEVYMRTETNEFLHVHETVLEDGLSDARGSLGPSH